MILFFTIGTVSHPKMVMQPASYDLGHVSAARFWHDLRQGDRHWRVSDTGWAKAAWGRATASATQPVATVNRLRSLVDVRLSARRCIKPG
jgi:acyl-coenzyme A synthetase/AMP-(fatty) acid ligase